MTEDVFFDLEEEMRRINQGADAWIDYLSAEEVGGDSYDLDRLLEKEITALLVNNIAEALNSIDEFSREEGTPLREQLLRNASYEDHVRVRNGSLVNLWDIGLAGDYTDIVEGQHAAWSLSPRSPAPRQWMRDYFWTAVYLGIPPEAYKWEAFDERLYRDIINARLLTWGNKAPFWIFVEFGVAAGSGPGTPYPSYEGKQPIFKTRVEVPALMERVYNAYMSQLEETLDEDIETLFVGVETPQSIDIRVRTKWTAWWLDEKNRRYVRRLQYTTGQFVAKEAGLGPVFETRPYED